MLAVYQGEALGSYGYEEKEWFLPHVRLEAFLDELTTRGLRERVCLREAPPASDDDLLAYHTREYIERMQRLCRRGEGALDHGGLDERLPTTVPERMETGLGGESLSLETDAAAVELGDARWRNLPLRLARCSRDLLFPRARFTLMKRVPIRSTIFPRDRTGEERA
jgi:hypothetical protein